MKDVVVVGAGIAGLTAAWELRDLDTLVLEADDRVGGRIKSVDRGAHWVSVGAHMFPGEGSYLWGLLRELDLEPARINGSLLGVAQRGKVVTGGRAETLPLRLRLSPAARISLARAGLRIKRDAARYNRLARRAEDETNSDVRRRLLGFLDDRTWADYLGPVHPQVEAIFHATANRLTAEPDEIAAGCMVGLFAHVWASGGVVLGYNLRNGPSSLPEELARGLGERVVTGAPVLAVAPGPDRVRVRYRRGDGEEEVDARSAIVTVPAPVAREIVADLPAETAAALEAVVYGALMLYGGAGRARRLFDKRDDEIEAIIVDDLYRLYPEARGLVREVIVQRWERAIPFAAPGRSRVQAALERGVDGMIFFAGDYVGEWTHMESAAVTAVEAAAAARARIAVSPSPV